MEESKISTLEDFLKTKGQDQFRILLLLSTGMLFLSAIVDAFLSQDLSTAVLLTKSALACACLAAYFLTKTTVRFSKLWASTFFLVIAGALFYQLANTTGSFQYYVALELVFFCTLFFAISSWQMSFAIFNTFLIGVAFLVIESTLGGATTSNFPKQLLFLLVLGPIIACFNAIGLKSSWKNKKASLDLAAQVADLEAQLEKIKNSKKDQLHQEGRILKVAVHDINNRIASLMNLNKLFEIKFNKMHEESLVIYNKKLEEIASELKVFTDNLIAPIQSKHYPEVKLSKEFLELKPLIENVVEELREKAGTKNISLNLIQTNKDLFLKGDKIYLNVVLRNLINYAIKFSQTNNQIIISTSKRFDKIFLEVMDKSRGIEKETLDRMFGFLPDSIEGKMEETTKGIGLSVAKFLTEKMDGRVEYESSIELGLHFSVIFDVVEMPKSIAEDQNFS